ncbi:hypothetical protein STANM309S_06227 [Streptomyces tanashiensis]
MTPTSNSRISAARPSSATYSGKPCNSTPCLILRHSRSNESAVPVYPIATSTAIENLRVGDL